MSLVDTTGLRVYASGRLPDFLDVRLLVGRPPASRRLRPAFDQPPDPVRTLAGVGVAGIEAMLQVLLSSRGGTVAESRGQRGRLLERPEGRPQGLLDHGLLAGAQRLGGKPVPEAAQVLVGRRAFVEDPAA